jgi:hypothetical protein
LLNVLWKFNPCGSSAVPFLFIDENNEEINMKSFDGSAVEKQLSYTRPPTTCKPAPANSCQDYI